MRSRVLFVGGERGAFAQMRGALHQEPYDLIHARDEGDALQLLEGEAQVVVAEELLPEGRGADFLARVKKLHPTAVRLLAVGPGEPKSLFDAVNQAEVYRFLSAAYLPSQLARTLREALAVARLAEVQEALWLAAQEQRMALERLELSDESFERGSEVIPITRFAGPPGSRPSAAERFGELPNEQAHRLSVREREIVDALGSGRRVKEIAQDLVISTHTVRNHLKAIYRKLNVGSQFELIGLLARSSKAG